MMDPTLPLTVLDYEEFGDPNIPAEFEAICSYSPYDNLSPGVCYPPVLVTASYNDTRFPPLINPLFYELHVSFLYICSMLTVSSFFNLFSLFISVSLSDLHFLLGLAG
jgi:hypothetical protein